MSIQICVDSSAITSGLSSLYDNQQLTDVRIVCFDGSLMAHKIVLASVSDKLLKMLSTDQSFVSNPMVFFADTSIEDIKPIIDCIYFGRQSIATNRFKHLTRIADNLGIELTSAVSAAFATTNQNPLIECLQPKPAHQNSLLNNTIPTESTPIRGNPQTETSYEEMPIDLSANITAEEIEANLIKVIESVATYGANNRRRKQSDPRPIAPKLVRFNSIPESLGEEINENYDSFAEEMIAEFSPTLLQNHLPEFRAQSPSVPEETQPIVQSAKENNDTNKIEINPNSDLLLKAIQMAKNSRGLTISEDLLKDCIVCGKSHATHKQLIVHLNRDHKIDDSFQCSICGQKKKYAKTFATHSLQCIAKKE